MAIFYQVKKVKNPKDSSATPRYYARVKSVGVVDEADLTERISTRTGVSEGIVAVSVSGITSSFAFSKSVPLPRI